MRFGWTAAGALAVSMAAATAAMAQAPQKIKVEIKTSTGESAGTATFKTVKKGVQVKLDLKNLPFGEHGVHIHQNAVCDAPDFKGAGGHFNPDGKKHGFMNDMGHHNGDFPASVSVGENHTGAATFVLSNISLDPAAPNSLFLNGGTSIVVHEKATMRRRIPAGRPATGSPVA